VIQPVSPDAAIRLTTTNKRGWPGRLDVSTSNGWQRTKTRFPRLHAGTNPCLGAETVLYNRPISYSFSSKDRVVELSVVPHGDGFKIKRTVY
jgi:hypothetical protein